MAALRKESVSSGAKWENIVGYSRAVKMGNLIEVAGTIALDKDGKVVAPGDPYLQTKRIIEIARIKKER
jgi:enamine deaminase RidA (YjgF/YER057c/UK114 family)